MQTSLLFEPAPSAKPQLMEKKSHQTEPPAPKKTRRVSRGKSLKRHPTRPPAQKRVVKSKRVALAYLPEGPHGDIVKREDGAVHVKWDGKEKVLMHNPRFLIPVDNKE